MYITNIHLSDFGKFKDKEINLSDGLNCIYGKNEDGKSTIKGFLNFMFLSLHQPYSYDKISEKYQHYKPFYSDEFKGYLTCKELHNEKDLEVNIFKSFENDEEPDVKTVGSVKEKVTIEKANVIGFQEIQGEKSKDLLLDVFSRIDSFKGTNIESIDVVTVFNELDKNIKKTSVNKEYLELTKTIGELNQRLGDLDEKYVDYKLSAKKLYTLKNERDSIIKEIEGNKDSSKRVAVSFLVQLSEKIEKLNLQVFKYEEELKVLEKFANVDLNSVEAVIEEESKTKVAEKTLDELKEQYMELSLQSQKIALGREYGKIGLLSEPINIKIARENIDILVENHEAIKNLQFALDEINSVKSDATNEDLTQINEERVLETAKAYVKYNNIKEWCDSTEAKVSKLKHEKDEMKTPEELRKRRNSTVIVMAISLILLLAGVVSVYMIGNYLLAVVPVLAFLLIAAAGYRFTRLNDDITKLIVDRLRIRKEIEKYEKSLENNYHTLEDILRSEQCKSYEEFIEKHDEQKELHTVFHGMHNQTKELMEKIQREEVALKLSERRILDMEDRFAISISECIHDVDFLKDKVEAYIRESKRFVELESNREKVQERIKEKRHNVNVGVENELSIARDLESNAQRYQFLQYEIAQAKQLKEMNLNIIDEETLFKFVSDYKENPEIEPVIRNEESRSYLEKVKTLSENLIHLNDRVESHKIELSKQEEELAEYKSLKSELRKLMGKKESFDAVVKCLNDSKERLENASAIIQSGISYQVEEKINEIIYEITGKYSKVRFNKRMEYEFYNEELGVYKPVSRLSAGTVDQMYIALRIALVELTKGQNDYPLVFDDSFIQYDKKRLKRVLTYLSGLNRQVIVLTCQSREKKIMNASSIEYNFIDLSVEGGK